MRLVVLLIGFIVAPALQASAQGLTLVDPLLTVDGERRGVVGAPLSSSGTNWALTVDVPGEGVYTVATRSFNGATVGGAFEASGLFFAVNGRTVRLRAIDPLSDSRQSVPAWIRFERSDARLSQGPVRLELTALPSRFPGMGMADTERRTPVQDARRPGRADSAPSSVGRAVDRDAREQASRLRADVDRLLTERNALLADRSAADSERDALAAERDGLQLELEIVRAALSRTTLELNALRGPTSRDDERDVLVVFDEVSEPRISLPDFDFARLRNPEHIRSALHELDYPRWARVGQIDGTIRVLFQSDANGNVVRTAVPIPLGGGLDALAEDIVRMMQFEPDVVDGRARGLRSQVFVRFSASDLSR